MNPPIRHHNTRTFRPLIGVACCVVFLLSFIACDQYSHDDLQARQIGWQADRDLQAYTDTAQMLQTLAKTPTQERLDSLLEWTDLLKNNDENAALIYANKAYKLAVE